MTHCHLRQQQFKFLAVLHQQVAQRAEVLLQQVPVMADIEKQAGDKRSRFAFPVVRLGVFGHHQHFGDQTRVIDFIGSRYANEI